MFWGFLEAHKQVWSLGKKNLRTMTTNPIMMGGRGFDRGHRFNGFFRLPLGQE